MPGIDDNGAQVYYGVSHRDGKTPVPIKFNPDGAILFDTTTTILFDPALDAGFRTHNDRPIMTATSSADNETVLPIVVNEDTGRVLVQY